jgi:hypothetical protein
MPALTGVESVRTHYVFWGLGVVVIAAAIYLTTNFAGAAVGQATTERDAHD